MAMDFNCAFIIVIFPDLNSIKETFPNLSLDKLGDDVAYPAMLTLLPPGLIGLVSASLIAAYMSTMSTLLNLGSSYLINDFYKRYIDKSANEQKLVLVGKIITVFLLLIGGFLGLTLTSANQAFNLLLLLGAGTEEFISSVGFGGELVLYLK